MAKSEGELQCVGKLEVVRPNSSSKPVGFLCGSIPVPTDNSFHAFNSSALVPSLHHTYSLSLSFNFEFWIVDFWFLYWLKYIYTQSECSAISDASDGDGSEFAANSYEFQAYYCRRRYLIQWQLYYRIVLVLEY